jgi:hypothetical protein
MNNEPIDFKQFFARIDKEWKEKQERVDKLIDIIQLNGHDHEIVLQAFVDNLRKNDPEFIEDEPESYSCPDSVDNLLDSPH